MGSNEKKYKPFSNPRWNQQLGVVTIGTFELTEKDKKHLEEEDLEWKETCKKLNEQRLQIEKNKNTKY